MKDFSIGIFKKNRLMKMFKFSVEFRKLEFKKQFVRKKRKKSTNEKEYF